MNEGMSDRRCDDRSYVDLLLLLGAWFNDEQVRAAASSLRFTLQVSARTTRTRYKPLNNRPQDRGFAGENTALFPHQYGGGSRLSSRAKIVRFEALETRRQSWCAEHRRIV